MIKYCKCGCGAIVKKMYVKGHQNYKLRGISHIERFGKERARDIDRRNSESQKGKKRGTWEDNYGKEKADKFKQNNSIRYKDKTNIERLGVKKAEEVSDKISRAHLILKEKIIKDYIELYDSRGGLCKCDIKKTYKDNKFICDPGTIKNRFGSLDNLAKITNRPFKKPDPKVWGHTCRKGNYESEILDIIEIKNKIKLIRQFLVVFDGGYAWIDGYDKENNIAYEVDENIHRFTKYEDKIREENIKSILPNIMFIRIREKEFLIENQNILKEIKILNDFTN